MTTRIKEARQALGWSQQDLAERIGVSQPTIVHWEQGTHTPRSLALARLADTLGVSRQWLQQPRTVTKNASSPDGFVPSSGLIKPGKASLAYLNTPIQHIPIHAGPLDHDEVEACLRAQRPALAYIPLALPLVSAIGLVVDDPAVEVAFPKQCVAIIECKDRVLQDGKTYLVNINGVARLRTYRTDAPRLEADHERDTIFIQTPPLVLGRLVLVLREY